MNRDLDREIFKHVMQPGDRTPAPVAAAALRARERELEIERNCNFAEPYRKADGSQGNTADLIPELYEANRQIELKLGSMTKRSLVRLSLANAIETKVLPLTDDTRLWALPDRLRNARQSFCLGFRPADGSRRVLWDNKVGQSRLCPDDAREDSRRMARRVIEPLLEFKKQGRQITYAVFTLPNYQPGQLHKGIKAIYKRFGALLKKRKDGKLKWDQVEAAMCVLEAPLARDRTWNVHLNVLLVHRGFIDYGELRKDWHWNVELQRVLGGREQLERSLREIIKYSARAVAEKSQCESSNSVCGTSPPQSGLNGPALESTPGTSHLASKSATSGSVASPCSFDGPPAMADWTGPELLEWLTAFRGFRRTRTYRALYRLEKPPKDDLTGYLWVGKGRWVRSGWQISIGPLDSIPGDKSTTPDALERWEKLMKGMRPPPDLPDKCERFA